MIMTNKDNTRHILLKHFEEYPELELQDVFKLLHQSSFGCEHMISSPEAAVSYLREEFNSVPRDASPKCEPLDGDYSRVHLGYLNVGLSADTLAGLFFLSAKAEPDGKESLKVKLDIVGEMIDEGLLPFDKNEFLSASKVWEADGFPPLHHSETFRRTYKPAYRVISNDYVPFLPLLAKLDAALKHGPVRLAVEGGSASGKTTLSGLLERIYDCTVFHMDDFFLRPEQRTKERFAEPGGNVDRERFHEEVLIPLNRGEDVTYRPFDCSSFTLAEPVTVHPKRLTVIEGAYSMHPLLAPYYSLSVFLDVAPELQRKRISVRNSPALAKRFFEEWIPLEHVYFEKLDVKKRCDIIISITD